MIKNVMFADDATIVLDGTENSFNNTISIFEEFGKISGLKLNFHKCVALKLGCLRNEHDLIYARKKAIKWDAEQTKALGIIFHSNPSKICEINFKNRTEEFINALKRWKVRKLTTIGNINVLKSLIIPKLTYLFTVLPNPDAEVMKMLKRHTFEFIWNNKRDKIKRDTIIQNYEDGGLKMIDLDIYATSIKCTWIKRLTDENNQGFWKHILKEQIKDIGGMLLFECNLKEADIDTLNIRNTFLKDIIRAWCSVNYSKKC